jgi:hypothetical protein
MKNNFSIISLDEIIIIHQSLHHIGKNLYVKKQLTILHHQYHYNLYLYRKIISLGIITNHIIPIHLFVHYLLNHQRVQMSIGILQTRLLFLPNFSIEDDRYSFQMYIFSSRLALYISVFNSLFCLSNNLCLYFSF